MKYSHYKKHVLVYVVLIILFTFITFNEKNFTYWVNPVILITLISAVGIISFYYLAENKLPLHKAALILILIFGTIMVFLAPPMVFPDEVSHFTRSELLSEGVFYPQKTDAGYEVNTYYTGLNSAQEGLTFYENPHSGDEITNVSGFVSTTTQSPFYSYIFSAIGILIAKFFNLTSIWALWFARLANLLLYSVVAYYSIKKVPAYKLGLFVLSVMPLTIAQASSTSYDAFILTFTLLILAYFIKMYKKGCENKSLLVFFASVLLVSLIKPPYILLSLLILAIPKDNFKNNRKYCLIAIPLVFIITLLSLGGIMNSIFTPHTAANSINAAGNISLTGQINYISSNPSIILQLAQFILTSIHEVFILNLSPFHYADINGVKAFNILYLVFFLVFCVFYKQDLKLDRYKKTVLAIIFALTYFGFYAILYLQWTPVGASYILGIQARYFIPVIGLLPLIVNWDRKSKSNEPTVLLAVIFFLSCLLILTVSHYY